MDVSQYRRVAIGTVAANMPIKVNGQLNLEARITINEWLIRDGELTDQPVTMSFKSQDAQGNETQGAFITNQAVPATWFPAGSNRRTPPNVRRGMRVEIYQSSDQAKLYWRYMGMDDHLMRKETIVFGINASPDEYQEGDTTFDASKMYWMEFSSHSKMIALKTSKADGEPYSYEMFIDTAAGKFCVCDDIGNFIEMVSKDHLIHAENTDKAYVKLIKKNIEMYAPENIIGKADKDVTITAGQNISLKAGQNINAKADIQTVIDGGGSIMTMNATGTTVKTPQYDIITG